MTFDTARDLIPESLEQIAELWLNGSPLDIESGSLTFDEGWAPFVRLEATCRVPETQAELDALDPRLNPILEIRAGYIVNGAREVETVARLRLDSRSTRRPDDTIAITAVSEEMRLQEWAAVGEAPRTYGTSARAGDTIVSLIRWAFPGAFVEVGAGTDGTFLEPGGDPLTVSATDDVMSIVSDVADRAGDLWVYHDGVGAWHVEQRPQQLGQSAAVLAVGANGTVIDASSRLSRDDWANVVVVVHEWDSVSVSGSGNSRVETVTRRRVEGYAMVTSGPFAVGTVGRRVLQVTRSSAGSVGTAQESAAAILRRAVTRGNSVDLLALAHWWLRPGDTVSVQLPVGEPAQQLVSRVSFGLTDGRMSVTTRQPLDVSITTGSSNA